MDDMFLVTAHHTISGGAIREIPNVLIPHRQLHQHSQNLHPTSITTIQYIHNKTVQIKWQTNINHTYQQYTKELICIESDKCLDVHHTKLGWGDEWAPKPSDSSSRCHHLQFRYTYNIITTKLQRIRLVAIMCPGKNTASSVIEPWSLLRGKIQSSYPIKEHIYPYPTIPTYKRNQLILSSSFISGYSRVMTFRQQNR